MTRLFAFRCVAQGAAFMAAALVLFFCFKHFAPHARVAGVLVSSHTSNVAAHPYQQFGQFEGVVAQVSPASAPSGEVAYRIDVTLQAQDLEAYGKAVALSAGIKLEAQVLQVQGSLLEWVFKQLLAFERRV